jgi:aryl-alcohol dehydrogenase-like predicted oxidoreductase
LIENQRIKELKDDGTMVLLLDSFTNTTGEGGITMGLSSGSPINLLTKIEECMNTPDTTVKAAIRHAWNCGVEPEDVAQVFHEEGINLTLDEIRTQYMEFDNESIVGEWFNEGIGLTH